MTLFRSLPLLLILAAPFADAATFARTSRCEELFQDETEVSSDVTTLGKAPNPRYEKLEDRLQEYLAKLNLDLKLATSKPNFRAEGQRVAFMIRSELFNFARVADRHLAARLYYLALIGMRADDREDAKELFAGFNDPYFQTMLRRLSTHDRALVEQGLQRWRALSKT